MITSSNSRSSSSQQLQVGSNKARALYAKQGSSACLLLQNTAQTNSSAAHAAGSLIPSPNLTKSGSKSSVRIYVGLSLFDMYKVVYQLI